jgi:L-lactate dehydrogenase complex protein LldF
MKHTPEKFKDNVIEAIKDIKLRENLKRAINHSLSRRAEVIAELPNWEELRDEAYRIKKRTIENLNYYLDKFEDNARRNGIKVLRARTDEDARRYVLEIAKRNNVKLCVKSKSMVTEEINLREFLEDNGIEVVETDLGEFIIQLAGEMPSHITAPAMHKSREEIGRLFAKRFKIEYTSSPEKLTKIARQILRDKFLEADLGISGANFLIAETGSMVIVENEGNAGLSTTLPKIHIAITGIEKVIPKLMDLTVFFKILGRSATAQRFTSYVSIINSPRNGKPDSPEEIYLILLDNGRMDILKSEKFREVLYCIKCGACMLACPVYQKIGGHAYGTIYPGPVGSVLTPLQRGLKSTRYLPYASSLCGRCSEICPVKIDIHHMLLWLRHQITKSGNSPRLEKFIFKLWLIIMKNPKIYNLTSEFTRFIMKLGFKPKITGWSNHREFPKLARKPFRRIWRDILKS